MASCVFRGAADVHSCNTFQLLRDSYYSACRGLLLQDDHKHAHVHITGVLGGECTTALAAGVNAMLSPKTAIKISQLQVSAIVLLHI